VIRLARVRTGQGLKHRLMLRMAPMVFGMEPPEILRVLFHRPSFFGRPCGLLHQAILRGPSEWTVAERELFAAWVSVKNQCRFCSSAHVAVAARAFGDHALVEAVVSGGQCEAIGPKVRAVLPFLEKLTLSPDSVGADDVAPLRQAGISDDAIADAVNVCAVFSMMNRMTSAIGCEPLTPNQMEKTAKLLLEKGYDL
jgi:uncharacterized peroxidase-related enzyme